MDSGAWPKVGPAEDLCQGWMRETGSIVVDTRGLSYLLFTQIESQVSIWMCGSRNVLAEAVNRGAVNM